MQWWQRRTGIGSGQLPKFRKSARIWPLRRVSWGQGEAAGIGAGGGAENGDKAERQEDYDSALPSKHQSPVDCRVPVRGESIRGGIRSAQRKRWVHRGAQADDVVDLAAEESVDELNAARDWQTTVFDLRGEIPLDGAHDGADDGAHEFVGESLGGVALDGLDARVDRDALDHQNLRCDAAGHRDFRLP